MIDSPAGGAGADDANSAISYAGEVDVAPLASGATPAKLGWGFSQSVNAGSGTYYGYSYNGSSPGNNSTLTWLPAAQTGDTVDIYNNVIAYCTVASETADRLGTAQYSFVYNGLYAFGGLQTDCDTPQTVHSSPYNLPLWDEFATRQVATDSYTMTSTTLAYAFTTWIGCGNSQTGQWVSLGQADWALSGSTTDGNNSWTAAVVNQSYGPNRNVPPANPTFNAAVSGPNVIPNGDVIADWEK
jgi:hypothetical protein